MHCPFMNIYCNTQMYMNFSKQLLSFNKYELYKQFMKTAKAERKESSDFSKQRTMSAVLNCDSVTNINMPTISSANPNLTRSSVTE